MLLHQQLCPEKKGQFARNVTTKVCSKVHSICLWVLSMCSEKIKMNCGSKKKKGNFARNGTAKVCSNLHIICLQFPSMCGENIEIKCGSSSDKSRINEYMSDSKGRSLRRAVLLHQQPCPEKKGQFARNVTIKISSNLHTICLWFASMCVVNLRMNCGSSSDENRINEYMSD